MLELLAPYAGHRHRAVRLILLVAPRVPRQAPRFSPDDIRLIDRPPRRRSAGDHERLRLPRRPGRGRRRRTAHRDRAHRIPVAGQVERRRARRRGRTSSRTPTPSRAARRPAPPAGSARRRRPRPRTSRAPRRRAARPGRCARRPSPGTAPPDTARRAGRRRGAPAGRSPPRRSRRARRSADPRVPHGVQQPRPRPGRLQQHEPPRRRVVRRRRGDRRGHRPPYRARVDRLVGELPHGAARASPPRRTASEVPSRNMSSAAPRDQRPRARAVLARAPRAPSPRTTATGTPAGLALDQVGRRRPARRRRRPRSRSARCRGRRRRRAGRPARRSPAAPIATSVSPLRQGRPKVSVTTTADLDAERVAQPGAQRARRGVRVLGQQQHGPGRGVGGVDAGRGHHQALPVLDDAQARRAGRPPGPSRRRWPPRGRRPCDDPALRLADDLRGDQQDVAVGQRRRRPAAISCARSSPGRTSGSPGTRPDPVRRPGSRAHLRGQRQGLRGPSRRWRHVGHHQRHRAAADARPPRCRAPRRRPRCRPASRRAAPSRSAGDRGRRRTRRRSRRAPCRPCRAPARRR